jgi:hypothetical protein
MLVYRKEQNMAAAKKKRSLFSRFFTFIICASLCKDNVNEIVVTRIYPTNQMGELNAQTDTIKQDEANNNNGIDVYMKKAFHKERKRKRRFWKLCKSGGKMKNGIEGAIDGGFGKIGSKVDENVTRGPTTLIDLEDYGDD